DDSREATPKSVRFTPDIPKTGHYEVYIYNPNPTGGGGNPGDAQNEQKASQTTVVIKAAKQQKELRLSTRQQISDWIKIGTFELEKGKTNFVEINNTAADGLVVADAVLFVPVRK
ncbi:MAG: xanthan lyase, partial [Runella sp.]